MDIFEYKKEKKIVQKANKYIFVCIQFRKKCFTKFREDATIYMNYSNYFPTSLNSLEIGAPRWQIYKIALFYEKLSKFNISSSCPYNRWFLDSRSLIIVYNLYFCVHTN